MKTKVRIILINFFTCPIFFIDRLSKIIAKNKGIIFQNKNIALNIHLPPNILFPVIFFILTFLIFLLVKSYQKKKIFFIFSLNLIILGAFSNLLDRLFFGYVIDFIKIPVFSIFNLADVMIISGASLSLIKLITKENAG